MSSERRKRNSDKEIVGGGGRSTPVTKTKNVNTVEKSKRGAPTVGDNGLRRIDTQGAPRLRLDCRSEDKSPLKGKD